jgi:hypothetical protein
MLRTWEKAVWKKLFPKYEKTLGQDSRETVPKRKELRVRQ